MNAYVRFACSVWLSLTAGCDVHHSRVNSPGNVDVEQSPERLDERQLLEPKDPGERMLSFTYGALAGGGVAFPAHGDTQAAYGVGPELSLHVGSSEWSHADDSPPVFPARALGVNVGWTLLSHPGTRAGPLYGELQYSEQPYWVAGGWAYDVDAKRQGPQATLGLGPFFVRYTELFNDGGALTAGIVIKGYQTWVRSE